METQKKIKILVRRKIPYLSEGLWGIVGTCFLILLLFYFLMLPTKYTSDEMATAYYILVIPEWLKKLSAIALAGVLIFMPLYFAARLKKPALLTLGDNAIFIKGKQLDLTIPFSNIKKIYFNDLKNFTGQPKDKMQIVIHQKSKKVTTFLLENYDDGELALDTLGRITTAEFASYDDNMVTTHDDDE